MEEEPKEDEEEALAAKSEPVEEEEAKLEEAESVEGSQEWVFWL